MPVWSETLAENFQRCQQRHGGIIDQLKRAKGIWVNKLKDYRDCFTHYAPVDTILGISVELYSQTWEVRAKIPTNPNAREIMNFKYSRRVELLKYSISVYKHMMALDKAIARSLYISYKNNTYPKRIHNLFSTGVRERPNK